MVKTPDPRINAGEHTAATRPLDHAPHLKRARGGYLNHDAPKIPPLGDPIRGDEPGRAEPLEAIGIPPEE